MAEDVYDQKGRSLRKVFLAAIYLKLAVNTCELISSINISTASGVLPRAPAAVYCTLSPSSRLPVFAVMAR